MRDLPEKRNLIVLADRSRDAAHWSRAAELYQQVLALEPRNDAIWVQYGHALKEAGRYDEAKDAYHEAIAISPLADTYLQLGHVCKLMGLRGDALDMYASALAADPTLADAALELRNLGEIGRAAALIGSIRARALDGRSTIYVDVTDLIDYFQRARAPTGIQRVVMEIVSALFTRPADELIVKLVALDVGGADWKLVAGSDFQTLCDLSRAGSSAGDAFWSEACLAVVKRHVGRAPLRFDYGSTLLCLGAPWSIPGYLRAVRELRRQSGVRYVGYIHDLVPVLMPELCETGTPTNYLSWLYGIPFAADLMISNSNCTMDDYVHVMGTSYDRYPPCVAVPLSGAFPDTLRDGGHLDSGLRIGRPFVLFVGTIEPRKDHNFVLDAWSTLVAKYGDRLPLLIFAGRLGWGAEKVRRALDGPRLKSRVIHFSSLSDIELASLYRECLFTVYNSRYEGWGLPVTESLSFGKTPVVPRHSGLVESGAGGAAFFQPGSQEDFLAKVEQLLVPHFSGSNLPAQTTTSSGSWRCVADDIVRVVRNYVTERDPSESFTLLPTLRPGEIIDFRDPTDLVSKGKAEALLDRGWTATSNGFATAENGSASLMFRVPDDSDMAGNCFLYLLLAAENTLEFELTVRGSEGSRRARRRISSGQMVVHRETLWRKGLERKVVRVEATVLSMRKPSATFEPLADGLQLMSLMYADGADVTSRLNFVESVLAEGLQTRNRGSAINQPPRGLKLDDL